MQGRSWHVNTVDAAIEAVRHGLCFAWLPAHLIQEDLKDGRLRALPLATGATRRMPLALYRSPTFAADDDALQSLARMLAEEMSGQ